MSRAKQLLCAPRTQGAKGKRACRSACARSRARQSPCRGAGAHGEGPKAPARVKAAASGKVPYNAATKQHQRQHTDSATDKRNGSADPFRLVLFFIDFCCNFCVFNALFYMFFMCFLCVFYVFFVLCPPLAGLSLLFLYGTLHISAHISAYQVCPAAAALRIRGADPFLRIFRFPQYSL